MRVDVATELLANAWALIDEKDPDQVSFAIGERLRMILPTIVAMCREDAAPAAALEVAAALVGITAPNDYGAATLAESLESIPGVARPHLAAARLRAKPIALGGTSWAAAPALRADLCRSRDEGPIWEAYRLAVDVALGASRSAIAALDAIATEHATSIAIAWVTELALGLAADDRARAHGDRLDERLSSGAFGKNARDLLVLVELGRGWIATEGEAARRAWTGLRTGTTLARRVEAIDQAQADAILLGAAQKGKTVSAAEVARQVVVLGEGVRAYRRDMGPFAHLESPAPDVVQELDSAAHYLVAGFRQIYGLELLTSALPRLSASGAHA